ncbi:hypothetical protein J2X35_001965 [Mesorhizobium sp. BE184]|nr:hypothetical protein [Mesorhizobium sp. BE184]
MRMGKARGALSVEVCLPAKVSLQCASISLTIWSPLNDDG